MVVEYLTTAGHAYGFHGWDEGDSPLENFDRGEWLKCLHGCMFALSRVMLEDDQLLHELVHLALGIEISVHNSMAGLRERVIQTQEEIEKWLHHEWNLETCAKIKSQDTRASALPEPSGSMAAGE